MKLETRGYEGPFSPKDTNHRSDSSVISTASKLMDPMADVVGGHQKAGEECGSLPLHPLYVVDMMAASLLKFGFNTNDSSNIALLV